MTYNQRDLTGEFYFSNEQLRCSKEYDILEGRAHFINTCLIDGIEYAYTEMVSNPPIIALIHKPQPHKDRFPDSVFLGYGTYHRKIKDLSEVESIQIEYDAKEFCRSSNFRKFMIDAYTRKVKS